MPGISRHTAETVVEFPGFCDFRAHTLVSDQPYLVSFERYVADKDWGEEYRGLPNDHCPCTHWGYVLRGKVGMRYDDGSGEEFVAGDAFVVRPGHIPLTFADSECVWFSTGDEADLTLKVVHANLLAKQ